MTAQQEMMKQLVSALGEVERGKQAGLANFLNEYGARIAGRPSKEDHARVKAEVRCCSPCLCRHVSCLACLGTLCGPFMCKTFMAGIDCACLSWPCRSGVLSAHAWGPACASCL